MLPSRLGLQNLSRIYLPELHHQRQHMPHSNQSLFNLHGRVELDGNLVLVLGNEEARVGSNQRFTVCTTLTWLDAAGRSHPRRSNWLQIPFPPLLPFSVRTVFERGRPPERAQPRYRLIVIIVAVWVPAALPAQTVCHDGRAW